ncbi:hypothetical protein BDV96DRAFT_591938 [Lophiotrema nucula]|uniref:Coupling of ubiquitin conjugation to ER degradation protein 1 n=1 Tax=Lophiotrema nucula TaxID=690887 RepID=A0A6A5YFA4_9PLEO|nr:hypothetical protein BDV96DRAFT_591938 [Lophiotrema nucula]
MAEQTLNIPQLLVFVIVSVLAIRWYLSKPSTAGTRTQAQLRSGRAVNPAHIDQVAAVFPQLDRRDIAWDLSRNGGNVTATTEKVLSTGRLDHPPASFQLPQVQPQRSAPASRTATPPTKPSQPDLITRYNLSSKLGITPEPVSVSAGKQKAWSQDREERQSNFARRREEMILAARRKMEEKEKAKATGASTS